MMKWIYTEYFNIYTQYITYFTTVLILLTTASALSLIRIADKKGMCLIKLLFVFSLILTIIDIYIIFDIFDGLRTMLLLMGGNCIFSNGDVACDMNIQQQSEYLKIAIILAIASFVMLSAGHFLIIRDKHEKKPSD